MIQVFNCFLQGDDVPLNRNMPFESSSFSTSRSRVPIVNAEPFLFSQSVGYVFIEVIPLTGWRVFSGWCLAERSMGTRHINNVTSENGLRVSLHQGRKTIPYGRGVFFITRKDFFIGLRHG